jgi:chromosome segregation ATPase
MARSGNGVDIAAVYQLLSEVAQTVRSHSEAFSEVYRRLDDLGASMTDMREAVRDYHTTVTGHGILYGELEQRIRRIERHLKLEPTGE